MQATLAGTLWWSLGLPLPWVVGPLVVVAALSMGGVPTHSLAQLRNVGQAVIGTALGLYFTPAMLALVAQLWWAVALGVLWAFGLAWGFSRFLQARHARELGVQALSTAWFASAIGAANEMTMLGERHGARTDLVAGAHSLRLLLITVLMPFALQAWGAHGHGASAAAAAPVDWGGLAILGGFAALGCALALRWGLVNAWFLGPWLTTMVLTGSGVELSSIPAPITAAAQVAIAVSLAVRFNRQFVAMAPRWLASVGVGTLAMMVLSAGFAGALALATGVPMATLVLATSPGGIAEMAITAKVLALGAPVVMAFHVIRLCAVLVLTGPIFSALARAQAETPMGRH